MNGVNQITIVGFVGGPPELKVGQKEQPFCRFSVAVNEHWKSGETRKDRVTWFPVLVFNGKSEHCARFLNRGSLVAIQGRVQTREFEGRDGMKCQVMQVVAERVTFLGGGLRDSDEVPRPGPGKPAAVQTEDMGPDEPF